MCGSTIQLDIPYNNSILHFELGPKAASFQELFDQQEMNNWYSAEMYGQSFNGQIWDKRSFPEGNISLYTTALGLYIENDINDYVFMEVEVNGNGIYFWYYYPGESIWTNITDQPVSGILRYSISDGVSGSVNYFCDPGDYIHYLEPGGNGKPNVYYLLTSAWQAQKEVWLTMDLENGAVMEFHLPQWDDGFKNLFDYENQTGWHIESQESVSPL